MNLTLGILIICSDLKFYELWKYVIVSRHEFDSQALGNECIGTACHLNLTQHGFLVPHTFYGKNYMLYNSVPLSDKKKQTTDTCNDMDESQMH